MNFLVYGAGALGQALGCLLAAAGHRVTLVLRARYADAIARRGLTVDGIFGTFTSGADELNLTTSITGADGSGFDYLLLTTKSYDTRTALGDLATLYGCNCPVVSMQNGCGNVEQVERVFGPGRCLGARIITGFEITRPGAVTITVTADDIHVGSCRAGEITPAAQALAGAITAAGLPCVAVADVHRSLFAKLLYNCALNPLGAILGVTYGALADSAETRRVMNRVIDEAFAVIGAIGGSLDWDSPDSYREIFYGRLVPPTADHRPSMLHDLENDKPTEVEAFVGYVSRQGEEHGIATPCCDLLSALIRFREQSASVNRPRSAASSSPTAGRP